MVKMKIMGYILLIIIGLLFLIAIIGFILPSKRSATLETVYKSSPEKVYNTLINNQDYNYRSDLKEIVILEKKGEIETWEEIAKNGIRIRFKTILKEPYSRYEFDIIEGNGFTGHWAAKLEETEDGGTLYTSTETVKIKNPFIKVMSYLFMDLTKFMESFQEDLRKKVDQE